MKNVNDRPIIKVQQEFNTSAKDVFDAWLDTAKLSKWMFGKDVRDETIISLQLDARRGGRFSFKVQRGAEVINHVGTYLDIQPHKLLVFTWGIESQSDEEESVVTLEFIPKEEGCTLILTHVMDPKWEPYTKRTEQGWTYMLQKMQSNLFPA